MRTTLIFLLLLQLPCLMVEAQTEYGPFKNISTVTAIVEDDDDSSWKERFEKLEFRMRELEDDFVTHQQKNGAERQQFDTYSESTTKELKSLNEVIDGLGDVVSSLDERVPRTVRHAGSGAPMQIFGRIHLGYYAFPEIDPALAPVFGGNPQDIFGFRRLRIGVRGNINDNMFYKIQTEFFSPNNFQFRDAFLGFRNLPLLQTVTVGNHKRPYNLDQLNSSNDNVFMERPFLGDAFNDSNRRLGISSSGVSEDLKYNWSSGIFNMRNVQGDGLYIGDNYQLEMASRLAATPWYDQCSGGRGYAHFAISGAQRFPDGLAVNNQSEYSTTPEFFFNNILDTGPIFGADSESLYGLEAVINVGAFQIGAEYGETFVDRFEPVGPNLNFHGGYIYAAYMLTGEHMPWNRQNGTLGRVTPFENFFAVRDCDGNRARGLGAWQIAARYSYIDLDDEDVLAGTAEAVTLGLNWFWNRHARMQFNYSNGDVNAAAGAGNYDLFAAQMQVFF